MERSAHDPGRASSLREARWRALLLVALFVTAFSLLRWTALGDFLDQERLALLLLDLRHTAWAAPALIGLYAVLSPLGLPISPLIFAGGAVFGVAAGSLLNLTGALIGAAISFQLAHRLGRELVVHLLSPTNLERAEAILARHGFWAIVRVRFLPLPFALSNYGAALAGVRFGVFLIASTLGLLPSVAVYTYLSYALVFAAAEERVGVLVTGGLALAVLLALTFLPGLLRPRSNAKSGT